MDDKTIEFYKRLKEQLEDDKTWPRPYLYKFIVPGEPEKIARVEEAFDGCNADIQIKNSSTGKFASVSVKLTVKNAQEIIDKYIAVSTIEGIVSL
ncbi:DUF493 family protein [Myroides odoratimimus]|uniref:Uncharacterized protein n=1 Tax=Myroides odoratimimus CIP 101113 TaxID=883154 RepID=A0AAV3F582_9FLAO|nr:MULTISPECIES: DUF493 family protein [Myroides]AJA69194.1 Protein of unknown function DUF493 [Myroides sp. A21]EHO13135.1 hypothetical protein HMPREF9714_00969 [Myroides odoratimimus CCUG 12901]EHO13930.1 hypothetical protein HMPREF9715_01004 [Myroides odoratimimus CIP 101113]EKB03185.1 hypothetical protein HMPREF9711_02512 [Myroides odoratimimus CCUG 3837]EPH11443.1 hypothetical protein HMPREF9713_01929 [Myroides odoratimimus CCUG 12700]